MPVDFGQPSENSQSEQPGCRGGEEAAGEK